jgi:putative ABC transport system permease protein
MIDTLRQDLTQALRRLRQSPGFALVAISTLAIGIGATSAIFSVVDGVLLRPLAYRDASGLIAVFANETRRDGRRNPTSPADFLEWKKASRALDQLTAAHPWSPVLTGRGYAEELPALKATPGLFDLLGVPPALGRVFQGPEDEYQVVLGHSLWQRRFGGDPAIVGQSLVLDGRSYLVAAVMPPGFRFPPFWVTGAEMWVPLVLGAGHEADHQHFLRVFGRLRPASTLAEAQAEMDVIGARLASQWPETNAAVGVNVEALQEPVVSRARPALLVLAGAVALVLLIACANVTSLLLAQGLAREKEAAIRAALGASRARLVRQGLLESVALSMAGGISGLALARLGVTALSGMESIALPRIEEIAVDGRVAAFSLALALVTGVVSGLVPAVRASRPALVPSLKQGERLATGRGRHRLHDLLVVGEFAMAVVLLVGAGLLIRSFLLLQRPDTGFRSEGLLSVTLSLSGSTRAEGERRPTFLTELEGAVRALPGVEGAAFVNHVPIGGDTWGTGFTVEGRPVPAPADVPRAVMRTATAEYPEAMGLPLLRGRAFDEGDSSGSEAVVLVNHALARRHWPDGDPVGARVRLGGAGSEGPWRTIVGVVGDAAQGSPIEPVEAEILFPYGQDPVGWYNGTTLVVRSRAEPRALAEAVTARVRATAPELPVTRVRTMPELLSEAVAQDRLGATLMGLLSAVALALAAGGMYGVMAYAVGRRAHEMGVRMALGARAGEVQAMVLRDGLRLGLRGTAFGLLGAFALSRVLRGLLHDVSPTDPATFVGAGLFLLAVAALASLLPARRAARLDPAAILREP